MRGRFLRNYWSVKGFLRTVPVGVAVAAVVAGAWLSPGQAVVERVGPVRPPMSNGVGPREIELTYRVRLPAIPEAAHQMALWIPLAETGVEQEVLQRRIESPVAYAIQEDPEYGNDLLYLTLQPPVAEPLEIAIHYRARLRNGGGRSVPALAPAEVERLLQPEGLVIIDEEVRRRAVAATAGRASRRAQARGIYDEVRRTMTYDKTTPGYGRGDTARACRVGRGNCTDFHSLFISMARAAQIPSRFKIGFAVPPAASGTLPGYHCWAEFWEEGSGWVPIDATRAGDFGAHDPSRFLVSTGRDVPLVPASQQGPVNILFYPYAEVDGQPYADVETEFWFQDVGAAAG